MNSISTYRISQRLSYSCGHFQRPYSLDAWRARSLSLARTGSASKPTKRGVWGAGALPEEPLLKRTMLHFNSAERRSFPRPRANNSHTEQIHAQNNTQHTRARTTLASFTLHKMPRAGPPRCTRAGGARAEKTPCTKTQRRRTRVATWRGRGAGEPLPSPLAEAARGAARNWPE